MAKDTYEIKNFIKVIWSWMFLDLIFLIQVSLGNEKSFGYLYSTFNQDYIYINSDKTIKLYQYI